MPSKLFCNRNVWKTEWVDEIRNGSLSRDSCLDAKCTAAELSPSSHISQALRGMTTEKNPGESFSYISLFRTPVLRKISLCSGTVW